MVTVPVLLVWLLPFVPHASPPAVPPAAIHDRIRPMDSASGRLVAEGERRSPTIAALLDRLDHSSVIVYISLNGTITVDGVLTFVAHGGGVTYVLVRIHPMLATTGRLTTLAHELQHAVEVAQAPDPIEDAGALAAYYRRIGNEYRKGAFESAEALAVGAQVRRELTAPPVAARAKARPPAIQRSTGFLEQPSMISIPPARP